MSQRRLVLLLRGVNLGGSRRLAMADLRDLLTGLGHTEVSTLLASGQAILTSDREPVEVAAQAQERLATELGLRTDVLVRTAAELADLVAANPFGTADDDGARHAVTFYRDPLTPAQLADLAPDRPARDRPDPQGPDEFRAHGRELYLRLPGGFADSRLAIAVGRVNGNPGTTRNWNTVRKLLARVTG